MELAGHRRERLGQVMRAGDLRDAPPPPRTVGYRGGMIQRRRPAVVALVLGALVALAGCLPPLEQVTPTVDGAWPGGSGAQETGETDVYAQTIEWSECGSLECATVQVPLDWTNPSGETISSQRSTARGHGRSAGFAAHQPWRARAVPGLDLTEYFVDSAGEDLLAAYDVIGFDPRGVGRVVAGRLR